MEAKAIKMLTIIFLRTLLAIALIGAGLHYFLKTDLGKIVFGL